MSARSVARAKIYAAAMRLFAERGAVALGVSDLAEAAGVARGTIYNNIERPDDLFNEVATALIHEMHARVSASMRFDDPAMRVATGLRLFVRRAHEEPHWGRFIIRFAPSNEFLRNMMDEPPFADISRGVENGRFKLDRMKIKSVVALLGGAGVSAMQAVVSGQQTWREAGSDAAELFLRATGVAPREAQKIAHAPLPDLALAPSEPGKTRGKRDRP